MSVRSGAMRQEITIQQQSTTVDSVGQPVLTWTTFAARRAAVERSPGSEVWASAQRNGRIPVVFRLRYVDGVLPGMRVLWDSKLHNIISAIDQSGLQEELIITAEELVGES